MEFKTRQVTYKEILEGYKPQNDRFGLVAYFSESRRKAFFANPNLVNQDECVLNLEMVDDVIAGRTMAYPTKMKIDNDIVDASSGSALDVAEEYRPMGIGATLMMNVVSMADKYLIFSGISTQALPLYKKLRYHVLEFPRMMLPRNAKPILRSKGISGMGLSFTSFFVNIPLLLLKKMTEIKSKSLKKRLEVKEERIVPKWVDEITLNKKWKYMEVHDYNWLQWNLDYNFCGGNRDCQYFYSIYKDEHPLGFFMIKERKRLNAGSLKDVIIGSIVEWGSYDENALSEAMINTIALTYFSKDVDIIEFASADSDTIKKMKRLGFLKYDDAHIVFKDKTKHCKDAKDINLWRVRFGYSDVVLS